MRGYVIKDLYDETYIDKDTEWKVYHITPECIFDFKYEAESCRKDLIQLERELIAQGFRSTSDFKVVRVEYTPFNAHEV